MIGKKVIALGMALTMVLGMAACGSSNPDEKLVEIGKDKVAVTQGQLDQTVALNAYIQGIDDLSQIPEKNMPVIQSNILETIIDGDVVRLYLADKKDEIITEEYQKQTAEAIKEFKNSTGAALFLKDNGITDETLNDFLEQNAYIMALHQEIQDSIQPDEQEEQVTASHILLKTDQDQEDQDAAKKQDKEQKKKAEELYQQLKDGADFAALAKEKSDDTASAVSGGALGTFSRGMMVAEFEKAAFSTTPGSFCAPVKSEFGYHIIKVDKKEMVPYDQLDEQAKAMIVNQKLVAKIKELRDEYGVKYLNDNYGKVDQDSGKQEQK